MLHRLRAVIHYPETPVCHPDNSAYKRDQKEDMKLAIEYLFEFSKKLDELHPVCRELIENMLQNTRY